MYKLEFCKRKILRKILAPQLRKIANRAGDFTSSSAITLKKITDMVREDISNFL